MITKEQSIKRTYWLLPVIATIFFLVGVLSLAVRKGRSWESDEGTWSFFSNLIYEIDGFDFSLISDPTSQYIIFFTGCLILLNFLMILSWYIVKISDITSLRNEST